jgi:hypothetical protein
MKKPTVRRIVVVTAVVTATMGGGIAIAAWTSSGAGTAGAKAGTAAAPTTSTADLTALTPLLYPGTTGAARILVNNPNPYPVKVVSVTGNGTPTGSGGIGTCANTGITWTAQTPTTGNTVPANGSAPVTLPGAVTMSTSVDDGCQGATFSIPVQVTVSS